MKSKKHNWILNSIIITIVITIAVQVYWNFNNYKINKQRVTNDIQISLDNALEEYYADIAKSDYLTILKSDNDFTTKAIWSKKQSDSFNITSISIETDAEKNADSILLSVQNELNKKLIAINEKPVDSIRGFTKLTSMDKGFTMDKTNGFNEVKVLKGKKVYDSLKVLKQKLGTILISMDRELEYSSVDSLLKIQFNQKDIAPSYALNHFKQDSLYYSSNPKLETSDLLSVTSKSTYIKPNQKITLDFKNPYQEALKLSFSGILISFLLSAAIVSCLFYLLKIINQQKQLSEIKNDLISNITHEFKTPIATISVALESIKNFNPLEDSEKTKKYLALSNEQLGKLNTMVEKLLETATLDSDSIQLQKDSTDIKDLVNNLVTKYQMAIPNKTITYKIPNKLIDAQVDIFHFENALNNILDNAVKYGGDNISVELTQTSNMFMVVISDNGNKLQNQHKDQVFEKFYRVPQGNTHDVKGFGIGLYYTKKIIEKHRGSIDLDIKTNKTTFKITIPNV